MSVWSWIPNNNLWKWRLTLSWSHGVVRYWTQHHGNSKKINKEVSWSWLQESWSVMRPFNLVPIRSTPSVYPHHPRSTWDRILNKADIEWKHCENRQQDLQVSFIKLSWLILPDTAVSTVDIASSTIGRAWRISGGFILIGNRNSLPTTTELYLSRYLK